MRCPTLCHVGKNAYLCDMKRLTLASVTLILVLPLLFMGPKEELTLSNYLFKCAQPCMMLLVFWVNYLWIFPHFYQNGNRRSALVKNALLMLLCSVFLVFTHRLEYDMREEFWHPMELRHVPPHHGQRLPEMPPERPPHHRSSHAERRMHFVVFTGLRDGFTLVLVIFVAYAVQASRRMARLKQEQQEAELRGLRHQMSPHFLLNTLNNIYSLTQFDNAKAGEAVMELSRMLRHTLYESQGEQVSLVSEAHFIHSYVELMRLRLARNVAVNVQLLVNEDSDTQVLPLLFVSLLENAFKHGVTPASACHIDICLEEDPQHVHLRIANSLHPKNEEDRSGHGIGMESVKRRLEHYYPKRHTWHYGPQGDEWVTDLTIDKC